MRHTTPRLVVHFARSHRQPPSVLALDTVAGFLDPEGVEEESVTQRSHQMSSMHRVLLSNRLSQIGSVDE